MFKEVFSAAVGRPHPQGMPAAPQSRAIYAIDLMLKWDLNEKGKATGTGQCQGFNIGHFQGPHCTWKTRKRAGGNACQGKHRKFGNFAKTQGIWFAQVVHFLILKRGYCNICSQKKDLRSVWLIKFHKFLKFTQGKFPVGQG